MSPRKYQKYVCRCNNCAFGSHVGIGDLLHDKLTKIYEDAMVRYRYYKGRIASHSHLKFPPSLLDHGDYIYRKDQEKIVRSVCRIEYILNNEIGDIMISNNIRSWNNANKYYRYFLMQYLLCSFVDSLSSSGIVECKNVDPEKVISLDFWVGLHRITRKYKKVWIDHTKDSQEILGEDYVKDEISKKENLFDIQLTKNNKLIFSNLLFNLSYSGLPRKLPSDIVNVVLAFL